MEVTLKKWGNSIGLRIPAGLLAALQLTENSTVDISVTDGKLIIAPNFPKRKWKYSLQELLAGVTEENTHPETDWGTSVGDEIW